MNFTTNLSRLLQERGLTKKQFLSDMHFGKNQFTYWEKNNTLPNPSTLNAIAQYFNVSVEYLTGEAEYEDAASRAMGEVLEWLEDNDYEIQEDETNTYSIGKNGRWCYFSNADFATESLAIKTVAEDGFELAMLDWERRHFETAALSFNEEEMFLLSTFRSLSRAGKAQVYQSLLNIRDSEQAGKGESTNVG